MPETIVKHEGYTITITPLMEKGCSYSITSDYKGGTFIHKKCVSWFPSITDAARDAERTLIHRGKVQSLHNRRLDAKEANRSEQMEMDGLLKEADNE